MDTRKTLMLRGFSEEEADALAQQLENGASKLVESFNPLMMKIYTQLIIEGKGEVSPKELMEYVKECMAPLLEGSIPIFITERYYDCVMKDLYPDNE